MNKETLCIYSCNSKYADDSDDESNTMNLYGMPKKPDTDAQPSDETYEDDQIDEGLDDDGDADDEDLPDGFETLDGVVMDTSNLMIQDVKDSGTEYKMYDQETEVGGEVLYKRPKREAGWHFILFEDPLEESGKGHLVLLQKLLGFTVESNNSYNTRELRLYEVFHVDLSNDITDDGYGNEQDVDNEGSQEGGPIDDKKGSKETDPNNSAEIVSSIKKNQDDGNAGGGDANDIDMPEEQEESTEPTTEANENENKNDNENENEKSNDNDEAA